MHSWPHTALNVADPTPVSTPQLIRYLGAAFGKRPLLLPFPVTLMRLLAVLVGRGSDVERLTGSLELSVGRLKSLQSVSLLSTRESLEFMMGSGAQTVDSEGSRI
ncbi:MAG: hypothetical protein GYB21_21360 [Oceanospirillales bacterium]|nr:hypothetical protein [Oceanospirillales bacterium]